MIRSARWGARISVPATSPSAARCARFLGTAHTYGTLLRPLFWTAAWRRGLASGKSRSEGSVPSFKSLGLSDELMKAAEERLGHRRPTEVQAATIPRLLKGESLLFSASTGTGKTLAYVLPIVGQLRAEEAGGVVVRPQRPRALILVPSRELALQVGDVFKEVCRAAPLRTAVLHGGTRRGPQHEKLESKLDVVVATPGRLAEMRTAQKLFITDVRHVVLDEADTLYDTSFRAEVSSLIGPLTDMARDSKPMQFVALGATLPPPLVTELRALLPRLSILSAPLVTVRHLKQSFLHLQQNEKQARLIAELKSLPADTKCMVFCNTVNSARSTQHALTEAGIGSSSLHGLVPPRRRITEWEAFTSGKVKVLVCTDLAARGLDEADVGHVVLFDFPFSVLDYIHRVGRTARAQRPGSAVAFVTKRDRNLAIDIEKAVSKGTDLWTLVPPPTDSKKAPPRIPAPKWKHVIGPSGRPGPSTERVIVPTLATYIERRELSKERSRQRAAPATPQKKATRRRRKHS